jgi:polysaccharide chain length determinant protein (PEP-CTERM system associated)
MLGHRTLNAEDYLAILKRRWWIIAIPAIILPVVAYAITFFLTPKYVSQTLVLIQQQTVPDNYVKPVVSENLSGRLASMKEQILSRSRLQPIIERLNLYSGNKADMDDRIAKVRKDIAIKPIQSDIERTGGLPGFFISFESSDPHTAQLVCGEITSLFVNANVHAQQQSAEDTTDFLKGQLDDAKRNLDEQDAKLAAFQQQDMGKLPDQEAGNLSMLNSLNTQLDAVTQSLGRMEQDKSYGETMLAQQLREDRRDAQVPEHEQASPQYQELELQNLQAQEAKLKTLYTDDYPDVVAVRRKIGELRKEIAAASAGGKPAASGGTGPPVPPGRFESPTEQRLRAQLRAQEQAIAEKKHAEAQIQAQIRLYQDRIQSSPKVQEQFKELTRDYQTAQQFYDDLLTKMNQSKMATDLQQRQQGEQFHVMDQPNLPEQPIFPKRSLFVGMGLAGGLGLGLGIVGLLEYRDISLRSERDIWAFTKLPTLAVIPFTGEQAAPETRRTLKRPPWPRRRGQVENPLADA